MRHERDYIERTIATVRNHRDADNCWPQWANIFADEIEAGWAECGRLREQLDATRQALRDVLDCKGSFNGTVSRFGGYPAICAKCADGARAALGVVGEQEQTETDDDNLPSMLPGVRRMRVPAPQPTREARNLLSSRNVQGEASE